MPATSTPTSRDASSAATDSLDARTGSAASPGDPPGDRRAAATDIRDVMMGAWYLTRRNLWLGVLHFVAGLATTGVAIAVVAVVAIALLIPSAEFDTATFGGVLGYVAEVRFRAGRPLFVVSLLGLATAALALTIAISAVIQGGVWGRLAHALRPEGRRATVWSCAGRWFGPMVGYQAIRVGLDAIAFGFAVVTFAWPAWRTFVAIESGHSPVFWGIIACLGAAASVIFAGLLTVWRLAALGPLLLDGRPAAGAYTDALVHIAARFELWIRLGLGLALVLLPAIMVYIAFSIVFTLMGSAPDLAILGFGLQSLLDLTWAAAVAVAFVFAGACPLVLYAWLHGMIPEIPRRREPDPASVAGRPVPVGDRRAARFGEPLRIPGAPRVVVMPLPTNWDNVVDFGEILPPLERTRREGDVATSADTAVDDGPGGPKDDGDDRLPEAADLAAVDGVAAATPDGVSTADDDVNLDPETQRRLDSLPSLDLRAVPDSDVFASVGHVEETEHGELEIAEGDSDDIGVGVSDLIDLSAFEPDELEPPTDGLDAAGDASLDTSRRDPGVETRPSSPAARSGLDAPLAPHAAVAPADEETVANADLPPTPSGEAMSDLVGAADEPRSELGARAAPDSAAKTRAGGSSRTTSPTDLDLDVTLASEEEDDPFADIEAGWSIDMDIVFEDDDDDEVP